MSGIDEIFSAGEATVRADRLLLLTGLLRQHGRLTAPELARRLEVSVRTVLRDVDALSTAGVPVFAERGRAGGFSLLPGYAPTAAALTPAEADALFLADGHQALERLGLAGPLSSALRKLATSLPLDLEARVTRTTERIVVDGGGWSVTEPPLPHLDTVQRAVLGDRRLRFHYTPRPPGRPGQRTVDPYGLVAGEGTWYLVAAHRGRRRTFRVSRMSEVRLLSAPSARPADLDLRAVWHEAQHSFRSRPGVPVRFVVRNQWLELVVSWLRTSVAVAPVVERGETHAVVHAVSHALRGTATVLAGFGEAVEVLEPPALRARMREVGQQLCATYAEAAQPPATAGMIETLAPSPTSASSPPMKRTSSSPT